MYAAAIKKSTKIEMNEVLEIWQLEKNLKEKTEKIKN